MSRFCQFCEDIRDTSFHTLSIPLIHRDFSFDSLENSNIETIELCLDCYNSYLVEVYCKNCKLSVPDYNTSYCDRCTNLVCEECYVLEKNVCKTCITEEDLYQMIQSRNEEIIRLQRLLKNKD